jgi:hypothetical protein
MVLFCGPLRLRAGMKPSFDQRVLQETLWFIFAVLVLMMNLGFHIRGRAWWLELGVFALAGALWGAAYLGWGRRKSR